MKKTFKPLALFFLTIILSMVVFASSLNVNASSEEVDDYEHGTVIVTLTNEQSLKFETYTKDNFSEIDCMAIKDLSVGSTSRLKKQMSRTTESDDLQINSENYHHQYKLFYQKLLM